MLDTEQEYTDQSDTPAHAPTVRLRVENQLCTVLDAPENVHDLIRRFLSYETTKWERDHHSGKFSYGGKQRNYMYDVQDHTFLTGFVPLVTRKLKEKGLVVEVEDVRQDPGGFDPSANLAWLRDYQLEAVLRAAKKKRGILHEVTGAGKGEQAVGFLRCFPTLRRMFIVASNQLVSDVAGRYVARAREHGLPEPEFGIVGDGQMDLTKQLTFSSFKSLADNIRDPKVKRFLKSLDFVLVDECFPAGTLVDGRPIEALRVGDIVSSFSAHGISANRITAVHKRVLIGGLIELRAGPRCVYTTETHKFWTTEGWVPAEQLTAGMYVLLSCAHDDSVHHMPGTRAHETMDREVLCQDRQGELLEALRGGSSATGLGSKTQAHGNEMLGVRPNLSCPRQGQEVSLQNRKDTSYVLRTCVQAEVAQCLLHTSEHAERATFTAAHDREQPDAAPRSARATADDATNHAPQTPCSRREWQTSATSAGDVGGAAWVAYGVRRTDTAPAPAQCPETLQNRHCGPEHKAGDRSGWAVAPITTSAGARCQERPRARFVRLDSVTFHERASVVRPGGVCPDGLVYTLTVENDHTYFANGFGVSNCHQLAANTFSKVISACTNAYIRIGMSGTPLGRSDQKSMYVIGLLGPIIYQIKAEELIKRGVLAAPDIEFVKYHADPLAVQGWAKVQKYGIVRCRPRNAAVVAKAVEIDRPLVFVTRKEHGQTLTRMLREAGKTVEFIYGNAPTAKRVAACERLARGDTDIIVCSDVFTAGIDIPSVGGVVLAAGGKAMISLLQRIGRGMRATATKKTFRVVDFEDRHHPTLERHMLERKRTLKKEGYKIRATTADIETPEFQVFG